MEDGEDAGVIRYDPGMKKRIPHYRIRFAKTPIERIRICKYLGIEQLIEARLPIGRGGFRNCWGHGKISSADIVLMRQPFLKFLLAHPSYHIRHHLLYLRGEVLDSLRFEQITQ